MVDEAPATSWNSLDLNSVLHVISFLDDKGLARAQLISKSLRQLASQNQLWQPLLLAQYGLQVSKVRGTPAGPSHEE